MNKDDNISIREAIDELMETDIFKKIAKTNNKIFAKKLASWLVRYILVTSTMSKSLKINLETVLINLHGEKFIKILEITEKAFHNVEIDNNKPNEYIW